MKLEHSFLVPVGIDRAWEVLTDIERIVPCMPGAVLDSVDGDEFTGRVKVKVGAMQLTYRGNASFGDRDPQDHRATIQARGQETRGSGTARATISATLISRGDTETEVRVVSDVAVTGKPAQFGRGVMNDVGDKLLSRFADCLAGKLTGDDVATFQTAGGRSAAGTAGEGSSGDAASGGTLQFSRGGASESHADDAIDLWEVAAGPVAKRLLPVGGAVAMLLLIVWWIARRGG